MPRLPLTHRVFPLPIALLLLLVSCAEGHWEFDSDLWKRSGEATTSDGEESPDEPRWTMRYGVSQHVRLGMSMEQVEAVLGPRSGECEYSDTPWYRDFLRWEYWLRKRRGGYPAPYLAVWFDSNDRVSGLSIEDVETGVFGIQDSIKLPCN